MEKEVRDALIKKCKNLLDNQVETPLRMSEVHDLLLRNGIPFNILERAYHVQTGRYLFFDRSELLTTVLHQFLTVGKWTKDGRSDRAVAMAKHLEEKVDLRCYRVNKDTGYIDIYDYDTGVVLFKRSV